MNAAFLTHFFVLSILLVETNLDVRNGFAVHQEKKAGENEPASDQVANGLEAVELFRNASALAEHGRTTSSPEALIAAAGMLKRIPPVRLIELKEETKDPPQIDLAKYSSLQDQADDLLAEAKKLSKNDPAFVAMADAVAARKVSRSASGSGAYQRIFAMPAGSKKVYLKTTGTFPHVCVVLATVSPATLTDLKGRPFLQPGGYAPVRTVMYFQYTERGIPKTGPRIQQYKAPTSLAFMPPVSGTLAIELLHTPEPARAPDGALIKSNRLAIITIYTNWPEPSLVPKTK